MPLINENSPEFGLRQVLLALGAICFGKSVHIAEAWQDFHLSKQWFKAGTVLDKVSDNATIDRISP